MARQIVNIYDTVKLLLEQDLKYRDSDEKLVCRVWNDELAKQGFDTKQITAFEFLKQYALLKLTNGESITRARRKIQEHCPKLRGATWQQRHEAEEPKTKKEIRALKWEEIRNKNQTALQL